MKAQKILIIGGGFAGIKTALQLARKKLPNTHITLVSNRPHFEYHATLYRVLTGRSPLQVCVPLEEIFAGTNVEVLQDTIIDADIKTHIVYGASGSKFQYDTLILALGAETAYYDTEGLKEHGFTIDSITNVLKLKRHLHEVISKCQNTTSNKEVEASCYSHIVVVGGGVTGCETAGELALYMKRLAEEHGVSSSNVHIELIHSQDRLMPNVPEEMAKRVEERLKSLGVKIHFNKRVMKEDVETVYMSDMQLKTKTLIWTAGVKTNAFYSKVKGLPLDERGRVKVDSHFRAQGHENVFVIGDASAIPQYGGMAQTALRQADHVADYLAALQNGFSIPEYRPKEPIYAIPVGTGWAASKKGKRIYYGTAGWTIRRYCDLKFFMSILPRRKAMVAYNSENQLWETCPICTES